MNLYVVVEGRRTEMCVYRSWLELCGGLRRAYSVEEARQGDDQLFLVAGHGYPHYRKRIEAAVADVNEWHDTFSALIVCVDAEEDGLAGKRAEIEELLVAVRRPCLAFAVVHDPCIETWFLGNRRFVKRNPADERLREYLALYDVITDDPELSPCHADFRTRAQFHFDYFRRAAWERKVMYSKTHPRDVAEEPYLRELVRRRLSTGHLASFETLLQALRALSFAIPGDG